MHELELADRFDRRRPQMRAVAYRVLGSPSEGDDAVQDAWLQLRRIDAEQKPRAVLITVVARICLNMLRSRRTRVEQRLEGAWTGGSSALRVHEGEARSGDTEGSRCTAGSAPLVASRGARGAGCGAAGAEIAASRGILEWSPLSGDVIRYVAQLNFCNRLNGSNGARTVNRTSIC